MWGKRLGGNIWADREKVFGRVCRSSGKFGSRGQYAVAMMLLRNPLQMKEPSGKCILGLGEKGLWNIGFAWKIVQPATNRNASLALVACFVRTLSDVATVWS